MSDKNEMELIADCHRVAEVNLMNTLGFYSVISSVESLGRLERAHELVSSLSVEVFPGALQMEQINGSWREALENVMNLNHSIARGITRQLASSTWCDTARYHATTVNTRRTWWLWMPELSIYRLTSSFRCLSASVCRLCLKTS